MTKPTIKSVLAEVNRIRAGELNLPPLAKMPKGTRSGMDCPLFHAFPDVRYASPRDLAIRRNGAIHIIRYTPTLIAFVRAFDMKQYPSLLLGPR